MSIFHAIVLGIVQGLTEFLPVSSTAHLVLIPWILNWHDAAIQSKAWDLCLHVGTLIALLVFFRREWVDLFGAKRRKLLILVVVGCIPAAAAAVLDKIGERLSDPDQTHAAPLIIAGTLILFALFLKWADAAGKKKRNMEDMTPLEAFIVGIAQPIAAVFPGASRSGSTMTFGLAQGLTREEAVRFSFLLSAPTIAAAALYEIVKHRHDLGHVGAAPIGAGVLSSAIVGYMAIAFLMDYVKRRSMDLFFWYRIVAGLAVIALYFTRK